MPDGNRPSGVLLGIVPKLSWRRNKKEREKDREEIFNKMPWKSFLALLASKEAKTNYYYSNTLTNPYEKLPSILY